MGSDELARDTIAAIATPAGRGAIGVVRISGSEVRSIAKRLTGAVPSARHVSRCTFKDAHGEPLDDGLALFFPAPRSYTGEDVLELHGHGGPVVLQTVLQACLDAGARLAEPGEFTRRAFLEGKLDLAQAEAVADLIDAASRQAARSALRSLSGEFSGEVHSLVERLTELRALTEAMLDFPEEEVDELHRHEAADRLAQIRKAIEALLANSRRGRLLGSGIHAVIAGAPNVGKSSLLNRLAGEERAIVTPVAGTTRDALREPIEIEGVPLVLVDTAGLRASGDEIERIGMERARKELERADVVLLVSEAGRGREFAERLPEGVATIEVYNKSDLVPGFVAPPPGLAVSAKTGAGLDRLREAILQAAGWTSTGESPFLARERHLRWLESASRHLSAASREASRWDFFAEELRLAQSDLGQITGAVSADELLGEIFSRFCIGK